MTARAGAAPHLDFAPLEGVHLTMPEWMYFDAPALGSSDFPVLAADPASWWYASAHNPHRRVRRTARHLDFGSALHALVLEGEDAYASRFAVEPDPDRRWIRNLVDLKAALAERGVGTRGIFDAATIHGLARKHGLAPRVWELARSAYERARSKGLGSISQDEDRRLRHMARLVAGHDDIGPALRAGLSEVSVFWRREDDPDTLLRARFDKLLIGATVDLKTFSNPQGKKPEEATWDAIADQDYDLQLAHYHEARERLRAFVAAGAVHAWGADDDGCGRRPRKDELETLAAIAAAERWDWIWIFYQVRVDDAGRERAPVLVPWVIKPGDADDLMAGANREIDRALTNYREWRERCGLAGEGWSEVREIRRLPLDRLRKLNFKRSQT